MRPLIPARWAAPIGTALAGIVGGVEAFVSLPPWGQYAIGAAAVFAAALGIEAPGSRGPEPTIPQPPSWP